ncbi:MAG: MFS transporter [Rhizobiales bacterium]|nr:MFS transporter [Hyphomicrobiales bacterium]
MHQTIGVQRTTTHRWWVLTIVVAAQFMFGVDAFVVNVAIPTIAAELHAGAAEIEAVIAIYLIAYATLVITGGRLGDIHGTRSVFLAGVLGFALTSLWCGLAQSGTELIVARLAQGATAALMVPQVLATIHVLFPDEARSRAFAIYGVVLGLAGAAGFVLGGLLVTLDLAGLGWRTVFFVNVPVGIVIAAAAWRWMPQAPRRSGTRLDIAGALVLFVGLLCLIGPLLFGHDVNWSPLVWLTMLGGAAVIAAFVRLEHHVAAQGGMPLVDLALMADRAFMRGLCAVFAFFFANLSFYLVMTLFMQNALHLPPLSAGLVFVPLALAFVVASRHSGVRARHRGTMVLIEGCALQLAGLAAVLLTVVLVESPSALLLSVPLVVFGYGQGLVMAPLSSAVLATVKPSSAGSASGLYGTTTQIGNAAGVAAFGAVYFAVQASHAPQLALGVTLMLIGLSIAASAALLMWMRRAA